MPSIRADSKGLAATVAFKDLRGNPVTVPSVPAWKSSDETVLTVTAAPDGLSAVVVPVKPGTASVIVDAEGDPVAGVDHVTASATVTVTPAEAATAEITLVPA